MDIKLEPKDGLSSGIEKTDCIVLNRKWSNEEIIYFLDVYKKYVILWDTRGESYRDKILRDEAFHRLKDELSEYFTNITINIIRLKIKMIRTVYSQELGKIIKSVGSGGRVYKSKLGWFEAAKFFQGVTKFAKWTTEDITNCLNRINQNIDEEMVTPKENSRHHSSSRYSERQSKLQAKIHIIKQEVSLPKKKTPVKIADMIRARRFKKKKKKKSSSARESMEAAVADFKSRSRPPSVKKKEPDNDDVLECFGRYIVAQMKKLPAVTALRCQDQIQSLISNERMALLEPSTSSAFQEDFEDEDEDAKLGLPRFPQVYVDAAQYSPRDCHINSNIIDLNMDIHED